MSREVDEQEQRRKVKARLRMLEHYQKISRNVSQTCRFFGISRSQFYIWLQRFERKGAEGRRDRSRRPSMIRYRIPPEVIALILRIREERRYGAVRMSLYLQRHYQVYVSPTTILKIFHRHRVTRVSLKWYRSGPKQRNEGPLPVPGQSVQVDVKFVPRVGRARQRFCQFTAIDEAARYRVLRVYDYNNTRSAVAFLEAFRRPWSGFSRERSSSVHRRCVSIGGRVTLGTDGENESFDTVVSGAPPLAAGQAIESVQRSRTGRS